MTLRYRDDLEYYVVGPVMVRIDQKGVQTHGKQTRLVSDSILMSIKTLLDQTRDEKAGHVASKLAYQALFE